MEHFRLTEKQQHAIRMMGGDALHTLLYGGSRSAKSFTICRTIFLRAGAVPKSRHLMARFRLVHIKQSLVVDTIPKMLRLCFPDLAAIEKDMHNKGDGYYLLPNGSEVWYAGLDDKERTEKILGTEFASIFLNECSQIPWLSRELLMTRLAQKTSRPNPDDPDGKKGLPLLPGCQLRAYYDENPPLKSHWSYKLFIEKRHPLTDHRLPDPQNYQVLRMNPEDNRQNVADGYIDKVLAALSDRQKKRFLHGEFGDAGESALWTEELLEQQRVVDDTDIPNLVRIVVAVDPSGASSPDDAGRDEIGIVVAGLGEDGVAYVLQDITMKGSPADWGHVAVNAYDRWSADIIVGEENFGGAMVRHVVESTAANYHPDGHYTPTPNRPQVLPPQPIKVNYTSVQATRGKVIRAEPISALYEQGKVRHGVGLDKLEDELLQFTAFGYIGDRSPNRADAAIWALSALFPMVVKEAKSQSVGSALGVRRLGTPQVNLGHAGLKRRMGGRR